MSADFNNYFSNKKKYEDNKAKTELRKAMYRNENVYNLQKTTTTLFYLYYVVVTIFTIVFVYKGVYNNMSMLLVIFNGIMLLLFPFITYYYVVDIFLYIIHFLVDFVKKMTISNIVSLLLVVLIAVTFLTYIIAIPGIQIIAPMVAVGAGILVFLGIIAKGAFV